MGNFRKIDDPGIRPEEGNRLILYRLYIYIYILKIMDLINFLLASIASIEELIHHRCILNGARFFFFFFKFFRDP